MFLVHVNVCDFADTMLIVVQINLILILIYHHLFLNHQLTKRYSIDHYRLFIHITIGVFVAGISASLLQSNLFYKHNPRNVVDCHFTLKSPRYRQLASHVYRNLYRNISLSQQRSITPSPSR